MKVNRVHINSVHSEKLKLFVSRNHLTFNLELWLRNYSDKNICQCAIFNKNEDIIGCFFYYKFNRAGFDFIITAPFAPDIELFYLNPAESVVGKNTFDKEIMTTLCEYFVSLGVPFVDLNLPSRIIDTQPFIWKGFTAKTRFSYLIDLTQSVETLHGNLSSEKRKSLNKAEKDGLQIKACYDQEVIYTLVVKSLQRNQVAKNLSVIKKIIFSYASSKNSFAYVAYQNNVAIGTSFCLIDNEKAVYLFGGFDDANKHHGAGVSCMWQSILAAKERGLKWFDFEGSMNASIERYFREFGGTLCPYYSVEKVNRWLKLLLLFRKK